MDIGEAYWQADEAALAQRTYLYAVTGTQSFRPLSRTDLDVSCRSAPTEQTRLGKDVGDQKGVSAAADADSGEKKMSKNQLKYSKCRLIVN